MYAYFTKNMVYGDLAKSTQQSLFVNFMNATQDRRPLTRPEMFFRDRLYRVDEHNALFDEAVRKGQDPVGERLALWH